MTLLDSDDPDPARDTEDSEVDSEVDTEVDTDTPVLVLKLDHNVMHHGALGVTRSLGRRGVAVHAVHEHRWAPAARSRYLHGRWLWRPDPEDVDRLHEGLGRIAAALGRPAVLLPTDDAGALFLAEHGDPLRASFLFPAPPPGLPRRLADKEALAALCAEAGMPCPRTERATSAAQVRTWELPLVVKRPAPWQPERPGAGPSRPSTTVVRTTAERDELAAAVAAHPGRLLLQEYVPPTGPGGPAQDWFFHGYLDADARVRIGVTGVKERSYPAHAGLTCLGRTEPHPELAARVAGFLRAVGYRGIVDLDLRLDPRTGTHQLLDANPRLGAQFRLCQDEAGVDVAVAAHLDLTGRAVPDRDVPRRRFLVESYDPLAALAYARRRELGPRAWAASLRGVDEAAWFARDDPAPFGLMCARMVARAAAGSRSTPRGDTTGGPRHEPGRAHGSARVRPTHRTAPREETVMTDRTDVAVIGAGPYGLSLGAHLATGGLSVRHVGGVMAAWTAMPAGMFLKSQGFASNLSDPDGTHTLAAFCRETGTPYADYGVPVALDTFVAYGQWFARERVPGVEDVAVTRLARDGDGFRVELADGRAVAAGRVVVATGLTGAAHRPPELADLPPSLASHTSDQPDLGAFAGRRVVVLGAGQSALESAALLHDAGADVQLLARRPAVSWNGDPLAAQRSLRRRLREPEAPLGSGWGTWFYSTQPDLYRRLPAGPRLRRARNALGPAGAYWLRPRVEDRVPMLLGHQLTAASADGSGGSDAVRLETLDEQGHRHTIHADHVLAGTGYRVDLSRMGYLDPGLRDALTTLGGTPDVGRDYGSAVPGLYFVGPAVAPSLGPVMRFAYGSAHAAHTVSRSLEAACSSSGTTSRPARLPSPHRSRAVPE